MIIKAVDPISVKKNKTFPVFEPASSDFGESIFEGFAESQKKLIAFTEFSKGIDTGKVKIASPVSRFINLRLDDVFELLALHEKRHFEQAKRVTEMYGFPLP